LRSNQDRASIAHGFANRRRIVVNTLKPVRTLPSSYALERGHEFRVALEARYRRAQTSATTACVPSPSDDSIRSRLAAAATKFRSIRIMIQLGKLLATHEHAGLGKPSKIGERKIDGCRRSRRYGVFQRPRVSCSSVFWRRLGRREVSAHPAPTQLWAASPPELDPPRKISSDVKRRVPCSVPMIAGRADADLPMHNHPALDTAIRSP